MVARVPPRSKEMEDAIALPGWMLTVEDGLHRPRTYQTRQEAIAAAVSIIAQINVAVRVWQCVEVFGHVPHTLPLAAATR